MEFNHALWGEVCPDGPAYCHWGGRRQSRRLAQLLEAREHDRVLEICCGQGGTLRELKGAVYGVDLSAEAVSMAKKRGLVVLQADARALPFASRTFTKLLSQDADVWMFDKLEVARELRRVAVPGARLVMQTYARSCQMQPEQIVEMDGLLQLCGYTACALPVAEELRTLIEAGGWRFKSRVSLHALYAADNRNMLAKLRQNRRRLVHAYGGKSVWSLEQLLRYEKELFSQHLWTGLLITALAVAHN